MANLQQTLTTLANNIRSKSGNEMTMSLENMASIVGSIENGVSGKVLKLEDFDTGNFTISSPVSTYTINHSLSQTPNFIIAYCFRQTNFVSYFINFIKINSYTTNGYSSVRIEDQGCGNLSYDNATPVSNIYIHTNSSLIKTSSAFTDTQIILPSTSCFTLTRYEDTSATQVDGVNGNTAYKYCRGISDNTQSLYYNGTYYWIAGILGS